MLDLTDAFASFPVLETERCILRAAIPGDAPDIFRIKSDPRVMRYIGQAPMVLPDEAVQRVQAFRTMFREQTAIPWIIAHRAGGQVLGTSVFWNLIPEHYRAEIGYDLAPEWWGQGLIVEAASAMLTFGFTTMGLHSVEGRIDPPNTQSRRVLEKLGFVEEGYFCESFYDPVAGQFTDTAVFSLLKATWLSRAVT